MGWGEPMEPAQTRAFLESMRNSYAILQLRRDDETRYERFSSLRELESMSLKPNFDHYEIVYIGTLPKFENLNGLLEYIYLWFNTDYPQDFCGRSLSVSDMIAVHDGQKLGFYFCDSVGFKELRDFSEVIA